MRARTNLVETTMYSVDDSGRVTEHCFHFPRDSIKAEKYLRRGFTFDKPVVYDDTEINPIANTEEDDLCKGCLANGRRILKEDCKFHQN